MLIIIKYQCSKGIYILQQSLPVHGSNGALYKELLQEYIMFGWMPLKCPLGM